MSSQSHRQAVRLSALSRTVGNQSSCCNFHLRLGMLRDSRQVPGPHLFGAGLGGTHVYIYAPILSGKAATLSSITDTVSDKPCVYLTVENGS